MLVEFHCHKVEVNLATLSFGGDISGFKTVVSVPLSKHVIQANNLSYHLNHYTSLLYMIRFFFFILMQVKKQKQIYVQYVSYVIIIQK